MKIKSNMYGAFYKDGKKWRGPCDDLYTKKEIENLQCVGSIEEYLKVVAQEKKKKIKLFRQVWKSVKS